MLKDRRAFTVMYTTYDNRYHIRQKHGENNTTHWIVAECGNLLEKAFVGSLNECKEFIYNNLMSDSGHKYKLEQITELNVLSYSRITVNYKAKVAKIAPQEKYLDAHVENISSGGCKILMTTQLETHFKVEETVKIQFDLAEFGIVEYDKLELFAEVRWVDEEIKKFGCKFKEMDDTTDKIFSRILEKFLL